MSFTADELQAFNDILDKKLSAHCREMEIFFERRLTAFRREVEQRLVASQQEMLRTLTQKLTEQQSKLHTILQQLTDQRMHLAQSVNQNVRQQQEHHFLTDHIEEIVDRSLAAQLLAIEELLNQQLAFQSFDRASFPLSDTAMGEQRPQIEAIEVQTELPWEDLMEVFGKALDERFATLGDRAQTATQQLERQLSSRIATLQHQIFDGLSHIQVHSYGGNLTNIQGVFQGIEQLERIIESMQVAMTANHALLSNRLFHHQQLPLERAHATHSAHVGNLTETANPNGVSSSLLNPTKE